MISTCFSTSLFFLVSFSFMHNLYMKDKILCHIYIFSSVTFAFYNITNFDKDTKLKQIS